MGASVTGDRTVQGGETLHTNEICRAQQNAWLSDAGKVMRHRYRRCGFSGAGNCCCGRAEHSVVHPHEFARSFVAAKNHAWICVCSKRKDHDIHQPEAVL